MKRLHAILHPAGAARLPLRYGPQRQKRQREAERVARVSAVVFTRWLARRGHTREDAAERLGVSVRALAGWIRLWRTEQLTPRPRGRRWQMFTRMERRAALDMLQRFGPQVGLDVLCKLLPFVPRAALADLLHRYRRAHKRGHRCLVHALRWKRAGRVWAMDFEKPPRPIDGRYTRLLLVRDLGSGEQLLVLPTIGESAWVVIVALKALLRRHGAPLVIKSDNGGASGPGRPGACCAATAFWPCTAPLKRPSTTARAKRGSARSRPAPTTSPPSTTDPARGPRTMSSRRAPRPHSG
jgi:hypothetical protein